MNSKRHNIHMLEIVASGLKDLLPEFVFVGGATVTLYLSDELFQSDSSIRPTNDVDCVIEIASRTDYLKLEKKLRALGFKNSVEQGAPVCRWTYSGVTVDIMPTEPSILGFSNVWYKPAMKNSVVVKLPSEAEIRTFSVCYFIATKVEAFKGRGKMDFLVSKDFEDIVTVVDGRKQIRNDLFAAPNDLRDYLRREMKAWIKNDHFLQSIIAHLPNERRSAQGARNVLDTLSNI